MIDGPRSTLWARDAARGGVPPGRARDACCGGVAIEVGRTSNTDITCGNARLCVVRVVTSSTPGTITITRCRRIAIIIVEACRTDCARHRRLRSEVAHTAAHTDCACVGVVVILPRSTRCAYRHTSSSVVTHVTPITHRCRIAVKVGLTCHTCRAVRRLGRRVLTDHTVDARCRRITVIVISPCCTHCAAITGSRRVATCATRVTRPQTNTRRVCPRRARCAAALPNSVRILANSTTDA